MLQHEAPVRGDEQAGVEDPRPIALGQSRHHPHAMPRGRCRQPVGPGPGHRLGQAGQLRVRPAHVQALRQKDQVALPLRSFRDDLRRPAKVALRVAPLDGHLAHQHAHHVRLTHPLPSSPAQLRATASHIR